MKHYAGIGIRNAIRRPLSSALAVFAIALAVFSIAIGVFLQSTLTNVQIEEIKSYRPSHFEGYKPSDEKFAVLAADDRLEMISEVLYIGIMEDKSASRVIETDAVGMRMDTFGVEEGRAPEKAMEVAVSPGVLENMGLPIEIGQVIHLESPTRTRANTSIGNVSGDFTVTGIVKNNLDQIAGRREIIVLGRGSAALCLGDTEGLPSAVRGILKNPQDTYALVQEYSIELAPGGINQALIGLQTGLSADNTLLTMLIPAGALLALTVIIVINNIFQFSIISRKKQFGMLRAIGSKKRQLYAMVMSEVVFLCGIAVVIGLIAAVCSAHGLLPFVLSAIDPDGAVTGLRYGQDAQIEIAKSLSLSPVALLIAAGSGFIITLLSALGPARKASLVSPMEAINAIDNIRLKKPISKGKKHSSLFLLAFGGLRRNVRRTALTVASLLCALLLFVAVGSFTGNADIEQVLEDNIEGDFQIYLNKRNVISNIIPQEVYVAMQNIEGLAEIKAEHSTWFYLQNADGITDEEIGYSIDSLDEAHYSARFPDWNGEDGVYVEMDVPAKTSDLWKEVEKRIPAVGSSITMVHPTHATVKATVLGVVLNEVKDFYYYGDEWDAYMSNALFERSYPTEPGFASIVANAAEGADHAAILNEINAIVEPHSDIINAQSRDSLRNQLEAELWRVEAVMYAVVGIIALIGVANILNTILTNLLQRKTETGMLRAIGASRSYIAKSFALESALYGLFALIIGLPLGIILHGLISQDWDFIGGMLPLIWGGIVMILFCEISTLPAIVQLRKHSIIESLDSVE